VCVFVFSEEMLFVVVAVAVTFVVVVVVVVVVKFDLLVLLKRALSLWPGKDGKEEGWESKEKGKLVVEIECLCVCLCLCLCVCLACRLSVLCRRLCALRALL